MTRPVCDVHSYMEGGEYSPSYDHSYLLDAHYMRRSVIQEALIDEIVLQTGQTRDFCRQAVEEKQGESAWLLCESCVSILNLANPDMIAARAAGKQWFLDRGKNELAELLRKGHHPSTATGSALNPTQLVSFLVGHQNPRIRLAAVHALATVSSDVPHYPNVIGELIDYLRPLHTRYAHDKYVDENTTNGLYDAIARALALRTGENYGLAYASWKEWFNTRYPGVSMNLPFNL